MPGVVVNICREEWEEPTTASAINFFEAVILPPRIPSLVDIYRNDLVSCCAVFRSVDPRLHRTGICWDTIRWYADRLDTALSGRRVAKKISMFHRFDPISITVRKVDEGGASVIANYPYLRKCWM